MRGIALQHNAQLAVKLALLIFITYLHYEASIEHYIYCAFYESKEPSSSDRLHSANGVFIKTKNKQKTKAAAQNSSNDCSSYLTIHERRNSLQMYFKGVSIIQSEGE